MKKNKKNNDRWQGYTPADCDCKYCVYYGGKKNGNVICLADTCVCSDEIRHANQAYRRERSFWWKSKLTETVHFFCPRLCGSGRTLLPPKTVPRNRNRIVGVHFGSCPFCGSRLCEIQRNDGWEIYMGVDKVRVPYAEKAGLSFHQHLLRIDETDNRTKTEGGL